MDFGLSVLLTTGSGFETGAKECGRGCGSGPGTYAPTCAPRHAAAERGSATFAANPQSACPPVLSGKALDLGHPTVPASVGSPHRARFASTHAMGGKFLSLSWNERPRSKLTMGSLMIDKKWPRCPRRKSLKSCGRVPSASRAMQHGRRQESPAFMADEWLRMAEDAAVWRAHARLT